jgi:hypothetical protein
MLVFIDESGDPGFDLERGSSRYFAVALVVFEDEDEAVACDQRIELLKREKGWDGEFHFYRNSDLTRRNFLNAIAPYNFFYYGIIIDKAQSHFWRESFRDTHSFYKYACGLVFENAKAKLQDATVVIDESGNSDFKRQLEKYLRQQMNRDEQKRVIRKVKMQHSHSNNLLQIADYIAGIINRSVQGGKKHIEDYKKLIGHREISVQVWPR